MSPAEFAPLSPGPPGEEEPVFSAPWEAEAFALVVALHRKGLFVWSEWTAALSEELYQPDARTDGRDYYARWLTALEKLLAEKGLAAPTHVAAMTAAWQRAARATPHGKPIVLENDPEQGR